MSAIRVAVAQTLNRVGELAENGERIAEAMEWAEGEAGADVLVLPELALTGYPLGDLVLHREFVDEALEVLEELASRSGSMTTVLSTIDRVPPQRSWDTRERDVAIAGALLCDGEVRGVYHKMMLPIYDVFDEARNFAQGSEADLVWLLGDVVCGVAICEDLWSPDGPPEAQSAAGAQILFAPNASLFHRDKAEGRIENTAAVARRNGFPVVYTNLVGGQDELVFDGGSIVVDAEGRLLHRGREFAEDRFCVEVPVAEPRSRGRSLRTVHTRPLPRREPPADPTPRPPAPEPEAVWSALTIGLRDYVERNGFVGCALGLSGGIDSTVVAAVAADALGPERVLALFMPSAHTSEADREDAEGVAEKLGIVLEVIPVEEPTADEEVPEAAAEPTDDDEAARRERRYARARAAKLTDIFDERGYLVLATGNKTEISIGEATVFGDLSGGFAPIKDCPKTLLYELVEWRNERDGPVCPKRVLLKETTAQVTTPHRLPDYRELDEIVEAYIEHGASLEDLCAAGHEAEVVLETLHRIDDSELIRRYAPPGIKVTARAFDQDRRMPLSNGWRAHRRTDRSSQSPVPPAPR